MRKLLLITLSFAGLGALAIFGPRLYTRVRYEGAIHDIASAHAERVAIVFGAGLTRRGNVTAILYDRVATAADLYHAGKVERLLLSGDNSTASYNEPAAMAAAARQLGVPDEALVLDYAGRRTYDTCYRARAIFGLDQATLVTQRFHLPRALYLCEALGLEVQGVAADRGPYRERSVRFWHLRELFATAAAWWDVTVARPVPVLGEPIPIL
jgi:SanA protein